MTDVNKRGNVSKFMKTKGYESISRDMLQDNNLSFGARGLLSYMMSLHEDKRIYKVSLYELCSDGKKTVERYWNELVVNGYIIQFRKSMRRASEYSYLFSPVKFEKEDIELKIEEYKPFGFKLYLNKTQKEAFDNAKSEGGNSDDLLNVDVNKGKQKTDKVSGSKQVKVDNHPVDNSTELREVPNEHLLKSTDVPNEQLLKSPSHQGNQEMFPKNSSWSALSNRFTKEGLDDDDYLIYITGVAKNEKLKSIEKYLLANGVDLKDVMVVVNELINEPSLASLELIQAQMEWCIDKSRGAGITNFPKYFLTGLRMRLENQKAKYSPYSEESLYGVVENGDDEEDIPLFNWFDE